MWHARGSKCVQGSCGKMRGLRRRYEDDSKLVLKTVDLYDTGQEQVAGWCEHGMKLWIP